MNKTQIVDISSFYSAFERLITTGKKAVNSINGDPSHLVEFCNYLSEARENQQMVHVLGMGRSGKVAMFLGEILKDIDFRVSHLGKSLAKPVRKNDLVIGVTGSGWTNFTCRAIEDSIGKNARILVLTSDPRSKAARLADGVLEIHRPKGYTPPKDLNHAPLTPMGTVFEMNSLLVGMGIFTGLSDDSYIKGFNEGINTVLAKAEATLANTRKHEQTLTKIIKTLEHYSGQSKKKVYIYGSGLDSIIASISSIRLIHCFVDIKSNYDWRFRTKDDLLIAISGSGASTSTLERVKSAKSVKMKVLGLSSFPESTLAQQSDLFMKLEGRTETESVDLRQITDLRFLIPSFEYVTALFMDSCIAQLAYDLGITESKMKEEHANIE